MIKRKKPMTLKEIKKWFDKKMKELDENPPIFEDSEYGEQIRRTMILLGEDD